MQFLAAIIVCFAGYLSCSGMSERENPRIRLTLSVCIFTLAFAGWATPEEAWYAIGGSALFIFMEMLRSARSRPLA